MARASVSKTRALASRPSTFPGSRSASIASTGAAHAKPAGQGSASPSRSTPLRVTKRSSRSKASRAKGAASPPVFRRGASPATLRGLELSDRDREPLHALVAEVHLHPGVVAMALGVDDDARAELRMHDVLTDAETADVARGPRQRSARLAREIRGERLLPRKTRREPLHELLRNFLEEARRNVVARLAVQHARLRVREVQAMTRARDGHVGEPALFFEPFRLADALLVREQALLQAGHEHHIKFQALRGVHRHHLKRLLPLARLVLARFERGVREERRERVDRLARLVHALFFHKGGGRVYQFGQVLDAVGAFPLVLVVLDETTFRDDRLDELFERQPLRLASEIFNQSLESRGLAVGDFHQRSPG